MTSYRELLEAYRTESEAQVDELTELEYRLRSAALTPGDRKKLVETVVATPGEIEHLHGSVARRLGGAHRRPDWVVPAMVATGLAAAAMVLATVVGIGSFWMWSYQAQQPEMATAPAPERAPPAVALSADGLASLEPIPGVQLHYTGSGSYTASRENPSIEWDRGHLEVEVDPTRHVDLTIHTREGEIRVVGTIFAVDRGPLGTVVQVERGKVAVTCRSHDTETITGHQNVTCLPTSAAGMLARAAELRRLGSSPEAVLAAVDRGSREASGVIAQEFEILRIVTLIDAERSSEAQMAIDEYLVAGHTERRDDALRLGAQLAPGCSDDAVSYLGELRTSNPAVSELVRLGLCFPPGPQRQRVLEEALAQASSEAEAIEIRRYLNQEH